MNYKKVIIMSLGIICCVSLIWKHQDSSISKSKTDGNLLSSSGTESERIKARKAKMSDASLAGLSRLTEAQQEVWMQRSAKVNSGRRILAQAHNLFKQAYNVVLDRRPLNQAVDSPFREVLWKLNMLFDANGLPKSRAGCESNGYRARFEGPLAGTGSFTTHSSAISLIRCQREQTQPIARLIFGEGNKFSIEFDRSELKQGFGSYASLFATGPFRVLRGCNFEHLDSSITAMNCPGLGQNVDRESYLEFDHFIYKMGASTVMKVHGFRKKDPNTTIEIPMLIVPLSGDIKVTVEIVPEEKAQARIESKPPDLAAFPQVAPATVPQVLPPAELPPHPGDSGVAQDGPIASAPEGTPQFGAEAVPPHLSAAPLAVPLEGVNPHEMPGVGPTADVQNQSL